VAPRCKPPVDHRRDAWGSDPASRDRLSQH
jgi:hypothetical protein